MLHKVLGINGYYVTSDFHDFCLYNSTGDVCVKPVDNLLVFEHRYNVITIDAYYLKLITLFGIDDLYNTKNIVFVRNISRSKLPFTVIYPKPVYVDYRNIYREVPGIPAVAVSRDGKVVDSLTLEPKKVYTCKTGYTYTNVYREIYQKVVSISVHRLVALAWVENPDPKNNTVVNHLDGNKTNNVYYNLEWTNTLGNNIHAINNNLRPVTANCKARCVETGEILEFPSLSQLMAFLKYSFTNKSIQDFSKKRFNTLFTVNDKKYEIRVGHDARPWLYTEKNNVINQENSRYIIKVTELDGTINTFNGTRTVIKHYKLWNINYNVNTVVSALKKKFPGIKVVVIDQYDTRPIEIMNINTNKIIEVKTIKDAVNLTGVIQSLVSSLVNSNGTKVYKHWRFRRKTSEPWPEVIKNKYVSWKIKVTRKSDNSVTEYSSLRDAAQALNYDRDKVKRIIEKPKDSDSYIIERIQEL